MVENVQTLPLNIQYVNIQVSCEFMYFCIIRLSLKIVPLKTVSLTDELVFLAMHFKFF